MKHLSRDRRIYFLDPEAEPAITIDSGEELIVETWDAFEDCETRCSLTPRP